MSKGDKDKKIKIRSSKDEYRKSRASYIKQNMKSVDTASLTPTQIKSMKNKFRRQYNKDKAKIGVIEAIRLKEAEFISHTKTKKKMRDKKRKALDSNNSVDHDFEPWEDGVSALDLTDDFIDYVLENLAGAEQEELKAAADLVGAGAGTSLPASGFSDGDVSNAHKLSSAAPSKSLGGRKVATSVAAAPHKKQRA